MNIASDSSHVDFTTRFGVDGSASDRETFLKWFPAIMITAARQHGESFIEPSIPRALFGSHPKMPLYIQLGDTRVLTINTD